MQPKSGNTGLRRSEEDERKNYWAISVKTLGPVASPGGDHQIAIPKQGKGNRG